MADAILADLESSGIYQIRNLVSGKRYIGSAKSFRKRFYLHKWHLRKGIHKNARLQNAWDKFGAESFSFEIVEMCCCADLIAREQHFIDTVNPEYNLAPRAGNTAGVVMSDSAKKLISIANTGNKYCLGREVSPSTREKIASANRGRLAGRKQSDEHISRRIAHRIGRKLSDETKAKISASRTGQKLDKPRSAEYRAKISESHRRRRESNER